MGTSGQAPATQARELTSPPPVKNTNGAGKEPGAKPTVPAKANTPAFKITRVPRGSGRSGGCQREPPTRDGKTGSSAAGNAPLPDGKVTPSGSHSQAWARAQALMTPGWRSQRRSRSPGLVLAGRPGCGRKGPIPISPSLIRRGKYCAGAVCRFERGNSASVSPLLPRRRVFPKVTGDL